MKKIILLLCIISCMGCASWVVQPQKVVLLPEERIFTVPAGQVIDVLLDKEPLSMTFPSDMKLVSSSVLIRQEQNLNTETFKKIKAEKKNSNIMAVLIAVFGAISGIIGIWVKNKATKPKE